MSDEGHFEHRRVSAATAPKVKTSGVPSAFQMAQQQVADTTKVLKARGGKKMGRTAAPKSAKAQIREGSMRHRCLQTIEACGALTTDGIAEAMGITIKQAAGLAVQLVGLKLLTKGEAEGRKTYAVAKREGFYGWLERKVQQEGGQSAPPTQPLKPARPAAPAPAPAETTRETELRYALFNTGELHIEVGGKAVELSQPQAKELLAYLDLIGRALDREVAA